MKKFTFLIVLVFALALSTLAACGGSPPVTGGTGTPAASGNSVNMTGVQFDVPSITITKGSTITFTDPTGGSPHNLVNGTQGQASPEAGAPDFGTGGQTVAAGNSWTSPAWNTAGTFHVTCTFHKATMTMTVIVQ